MKMNTPNPERVFPLSTGSFERAPLRAPRLSVNSRPVSGAVMDHRASGGWALRRMAQAAASAAAAALAPAPQDGGPPEGLD
jgi:hypothetical protein